MGTIPLTSINWTACELIETIPGKVSGKPIVLGTRILPDASLTPMTLANPWT